MSLHFVVQFTMSDAVARLHESYILCDTECFWRICWNWFFFWGAI